MKKRRIIILVVVAIPVLVLLAGVLYLALADFGNYKVIVEEAATRALGRKVVISGRFEPKIRLTSSLVVEELTLANAGWGAEPLMVEVERIACTLDLWSLISGPVRIHDLEIHGIKVHLEAGDDGSGNWEFETMALEGRMAEESSVLPGIEIENIHIEDLLLTYDSPSSPERLECRIREATASLPADGVLHVALDGACGADRLELAGRLETLQAVLSGEAVKCEFEGRLGEIRVNAGGSVEVLAGIQGPDLFFSLDGPELLEFTERFGLRSMGEGPFQVEGRVSPQGGDLKITLKADLGEWNGQVDGTAESLLEPGNLDLDLSASGPDLHALGRLTGINGLPAGPFGVSCSVQRDDGRWSCESLVVEAGDSRMQADGVLGEPPGMLGTDLSFQVEGKELDVFRELAGLDLPSGPFRANGHLARIDNGLELRDVEAEVGDLSLNLDGILGDGPNFAGTELEVQAEGTDLALLNRVLGVALPHGRFQVEGRFAWDDDTVRLGPTRGFLKENRFQVEGTIVPLPGMTGTDLRFQAFGPDLAAAGAMAGMEGMPEEPFTVQGRLKVRSDRYELHQVRAKVGEYEATADGDLGLLPDPAGTDVSLQVSGPDLAEFGELIRLPALPSGRFQVSGRLGIDQAIYRLTGVTGELDSNQVRVDGVLGPFPGMSATRLEGMVAGPALTSLERILSESGLSGWPELPEGPYELSGLYAWIGDHLVLENAAARLGDVVLRADGTLYPAAGMVGTDLSLELEGPDASFLEILAGVDLPADRFRLQGRVEKLESGHRFHAVQAGLGDYHCAVEGTLGDLPDLVGTELDLSVEGPGLGLIRRFVDLPTLPEGAFAFDGRLDGSPKRLSVPRFTARWGGSDLEGRLRLSLEEELNLEGEVRSGLLDLTAFTGDDVPDETTDENGERLIPDTPFRFTFLKNVDVDLHWSVDRLVGSLATIRNLEVGARVLDGRLRLDLATTGDPRTGTTRVGLVLEPQGGEYVLEAEGKGQDIRLDLLHLPGDAGGSPTIDVEFRLSGRGGSAHQIAGSLDGWFGVIASAGRIEGLDLDVLSIDILTQLVEAINPNVKQEPYTDMDCAVIFFELDDGLAVIDPLAVQTERSTVAGAGSINLKTEELDLHWATKPRKGLGVSASVITNSYIKLGGTLSRPAVVIRPARAATATGAAVATAGLSLVVRGLWDRVTAEKKVCRRAIRETESKTTEHQVGQAGESVFDYD